MHKPFQQTVVPSEAVADLMASIPVNQLNGFGGKRGEKLVADYKIAHVGDLLAFPLSKLQRDFGGSAGRFMWEAARGICDAKVVQKLIMDSISNGKTFTGNTVPGGRLQTMTQVAHFCGTLCVEVFARMALLKQRHARVPTLCTVSVHHGTETVVRKVRQFRPFPALYVCLSLSSWGLVWSVYLAFVAVAVCFSRARDGHNHRKDALAPPRGAGFFYYFFARSHCLSL